ncbi:MAG: hypothetical protein ACR2M0_12885 [Chloroflexia bacterium]
MSEPIPFPHPSGNFPADDATEVTMDRPEASGASQRETRLLPDEAEILAGISGVLTAPLDLLPVETRAHLKNAGREAALTFSSLAGTLLKGASIALNVAAETLKDYSERNAVPGAGAADRSRRRVDIEVE